MTRRVRLTMLCLLLLAMAVNLACSAARAEAFGADDWRRELAFAAVTWIDWQQTHDIANHQGMYELNPLLGRHPSAGRIDRYFAAGLLTHLAVSAVLPSPYRAGFQRASITIECAVVARNAYLGLHVRF